MTIKYISPMQVKDTIEAAGDKFFAVTFVKRGDNTVREMNCRRKVKKGIKGSGRRIRKSGLMSVYDMVEKEFRTINLSGVHRIRISGVEYRVSVN